MKKDYPIEKKSGGLFSIIMKTVLVLLVLYALGKITYNITVISKARKTVSELSSQADLAERTLEKVAKSTAEEPDEDDLLDIAHDSGYVLPDERVFEDPSGK